nr:unnamed protein product [Digitaria exilis]
MHAGRGGRASATAAASTRQHQEHLDAHEEVGAVLEVVPPLDEGPPRGVDGGVGLGGGVELPDLSADVAVLRAQPWVPTPVRDLQPPHLFPLLLLLSPRTMRPRRRREIPAGESAALLGSSLARGSSLLRSGGGGPL